MLKFSIIIPVYNRPDEVAELLESLTHLSCPDIEILVIEDGSSVPCDEVVKRFEGKLPVRYFSKPNSGPGQTRNYGAERAKGEYLLIWDSDILRELLMRSLNHLRTLTGIQLRRFLR